MAISRSAARFLSRKAQTGLKLICAAALAMQVALPAHADVNQAIQKYNAKDYQGALNEFKAVVAREPRNGLCRYYMALCNQCLARVDEAKKDYQWVVENGPANLKANAQTGLSQLEKVSGRTGGSTASAAPAPAPAATTSDTARSGGGLIETSKELQDKGKDMAGKTAAAGKGKDGKEAATKTAAAPGGNVGKVINFFSESARASQLTEPSWEEAKAKYPKLQFQKVNAGDALCEQYGVTEFPTIIVLDKNGKVMSTQAGQQSTDSICTAIDTCLKK